MITVDQIQIILKHAAKAPSTVGEVMNDGHAFRALLEIQGGLINGKTLRWFDGVKVTQELRPDEPPIAPVVS